MHDEPGGHLIVHVNDQCLWKNQEIHESFGFVGELAGKSRISVTWPIVSTQFSAYDTTRTKFCHVYAWFGHRSAYFDFSAEFSIKLSKKRGVPFDELFVY